MVNKFAVTAATDAGTHHRHLRIKLGIGPRRNLNDCAILHMRTDIAFPPQSKVLQVGMTFTGSGDTPEGVRADFSAACANLNPTSGSAATILLTLTKSRRVTCEMMSLLSIFFITLTRKKINHPTLNPNSSLWDIKSMLFITHFWVNIIVLPSFLHR